MTNQKQSKALFRRALWPQEAQTMRVDEDASATESVHSGDETESVDRDGKSEDTESEPEFEVESILGHRILKGSSQYHLKWKVNADAHQDSRASP